MTRAKRTSKPPDIRQGPQGKETRRGFLGDPQQELICWHVGTMDRGGPFRWNLSKKQWADLLEWMKKKESMKWSELSGKTDHSISVGDLSPDARLRLRQLRHEDIDEVFSMHFNNQIHRIIGIRDRHVMKLLWWDPDHKVCLSHKKHT
jgi:hypothetical protein